MNAHNVEWLYATVKVDDVEDYLRCAWMVVLPSRHVPVGDAYVRIPMQRPCKCEPIIPVMHKL